MNLQLWSKVEEKSGTVLALRGDEIHRLEIRGNKARQDASRIIQALQDGQDPSAIGANAIRTLKLESIGTIRVSPGQDDVEFHGAGDAAEPVKFSTSGRNGAAIAQTVLARVGRPFREERQDISTAEAVTPPLIIGVIVGFLWALLYGAAGQVAAGEEIEVHGRRAGLKRLLILVAETLGINGTLVLGGLLLAWIIGWTAMRVIRRPQRTIWLAESQA